MLGLSKVTVRILVVNSFLLFMMVGAVSAILTDTPYWPFSPYTMYSQHPKTKDLNYVALFAVTPKGEIPVWAGCNLPPSYYRLRNWLQERYEKGEWRVLRGIMIDCLKDEKAAGRLGWEKLRLYWLAWDFKKFDPKDRGPLARTLLMEVSTH